ncbi:RidA family protein [Rubellimicrobium sp. CFH 75288]|uniref:RidA family protein n=1 Tax=Rubellimicrobium sp. CFH 75288 TaxID=2697034 RepID=UPI0014126E0D|nr:RidA family protein [Rubellimicrobium sp. CFH 75288]NAZ37351.1 RidA family protein [Rubellimicrobium sp. CFH 75288]
MPPSSRPSSIRRLEPTGRLSQAVVWRGLVRISGQVAGERPPADIEAQTRLVLERLDTRLAEAGTDRLHLLSAEVFLADMADFAAMNRVWEAWIDPQAQPARITVQTPMTRPDWRVAVAAWAVLPER